MFAARLLGCEGDGNAGVGSGGGVVGVSAYMGGTRESGVLASAGDVLNMGVRQKYEKPGNFMQSIFVD